ncbi:carbamoyltransferase C-terminal domain-containing protein [Methanotorris formicicus]|uniref:Carbamoyltransferase n=1 Tax=Methanotorris formicicus Mc-S-70 TaxID=647171 RepID=H1KX13_9EURY|nr:carbamoyltransferase C-terminal domain-containing protein [Methanotorris formicicus]EHP88839.1 Carbamoyltransferase [Methanotorris formicicus Mc-S-70]
MILGIHDGHNASASLIDNDKIIYAISEERFTRKKNQRGFPKNSIEHILKNANIGDIEAIAIGGIFRKGNRLRALKKFQEKMQIPTLYFHHHLCHASLYQLSNFKECIVLTIDGGGDGLSATVSIANKNGLEIIAQSDLIDSVGDFYASITELLGFKPMEDEGKVMCLSSYDGSDDIDLKVIDYNPKTKSFKNYLGVIGYEATKALKKLIGYDDSFEFKVRVSKYAQRTLEDVVLKLIRSFVDETGIENVVFSGGVAQNVKLNMKVNEIANLYIPPFMGDEGLSVGAPLLMKKCRIDLKNTYLGIEIDNDEIANKLESVKDKYKIRYLEEEEIPEVVGDLIANNKIVCICRGKMEFGPRALGNRSIIALPTKENAEKINKILKRSEFMPFAPTILYEHVDEYLENPTYSPFMTMLFKVKEESREKINGVVHVDNTTRPQTLKREVNPTYYDIINHVFESKGVPVVLNTSFNMHGEPIVGTVDDALRTFRYVGDALLLGNYLMEKIYI